MKKSEIGTIMGLVIAVIAGVFYIGKLEGRLSALENTDVIKKAKDAALQEILTTQNQALAEWGNILKLSDGIVLSYVGNAESIPNGWVICGQNGTTSLVGRFLMGTEDFSKVGDFIGSNEHHHPIHLTSGGEVNGHAGISPEGADNWTGAPNWVHQHRVSGSTHQAPHIPPTVQVLFLCRPITE